MLVLAGVIPLQYVWGGRATSRSQAVPLEIFTILFNAGIIHLCAMKLGMVKSTIRPKSLQSLLVLSIAVMAGNLFAKTNQEKVLSILTLSSAYGIWVIFKAKSPKS